MKYFSNKKGFTLIELLVVIAIIAILTAIITANFTQAKAKSRDAKRVSDLAQIQLALEMAFDRCNSYPATIDTGATIKTGCQDTLTSQDYKFGYFISKIPTPPTAGESYEYGVDSNHYDYRLKATLETNSTALNDGTKGTTYNINCDTALAYCVQPK